MGKEKRTRTVRGKEGPLKKIPRRAKSSTQETQPVEVSVNTLLQQLQFSDFEHKLCGLQTFGNLLECEDNFNILVEKNVVRSVAPLLLEDNSMIRDAAAGTLRNFSTLSLEACDHLIDQDVLTLLITFFQKYDQNWIPKKTKSGSIDEDGDAFLQSVNLLWNLCESSEIPIKRIDEATLLPILTRCLDREIFGDDITISILRCILVVIEDNMKATGEIKVLCGNFINQVIGAEVEKPVDGLVRILATAIFLTMEPLSSFSHDTLEKLMDILSASLSIDLRSPCHKLSSSLPLMDDTADPEKHKQTVALKSEILDLKYMFDTVQTAVEILANICCPPDEETMDIDESSDVDSEIEDNDLCIEDSNTSIGDNLDNRIPSNLSSIIKAKGILDLLWQKNIPLADNVALIFKESEEGYPLLIKMFSLQSKSLLCMNNLIENLPLSDLGEVPGVYNMWVEMGKLLFKLGVNDENILESATTVMRAALSRIKKETINNEQTPNSSNMFKDLSVDDLQNVFNGINQSKNPEIRANLSRMIGDLGLITASKNGIPSNIEIVISKFLLDRMCKESEFWVTAELVDTVMDLFSEDESDQLALQINLIEKLSQVAPVIKNKSRQLRKSLGEHFAVVNTVAGNLPRFMKYKNNRIQLLLKHNK